MRDFILLFINGLRYEVKGAEVFLTLSDYLRQSLGLRGTKIVCSEGDCGSCSVLVGKPDGDARLSYHSIDSCIQFVFQLDGKHVVTVEGLADSDSTYCSDVGTRLNEVQQAMIDCHGSQCGFCTPGFVVAMTGLLQERRSLSTKQWRAGLTGNLCRCTGYSPIVEAGLKAQESQTRTLNEMYDATEILAAFRETQRDSISIRDDIEQLQVFCPTSLDETLQLLARHPDAKIVAGATDVGVQFNKGLCEARIWIDLNRVTELEGVSVQDNTIDAGARATWAEIQTIARQVEPEFEKIVSVFGSPQIRHAGTLGGNIINASPVADSLPLLLVCHAQLTISSVNKTRTVDINDFYYGYKKFDLNSGELLTRITIPLPKTGLLRLYKVSRRLDLDISSFTAAIWLETEGSNNGALNRDSKIVDAKIAYGAVGTTVLRLSKTEEFLRDKLLNEETMIAAGDIAVAEITPISDVGGSDEYRYNLARNVLVKYYHQSQSRSSITV